MPFSVHTFEVKNDGKNLGYAFHEMLGEGQDCYFLAKFPENTVDAQTIAETLFGVLVDNVKNSRFSDGYDKFEEALKITNLEARKWRGKMAGIPEIVIAYFDFQHLFLSQCGQSEAYLVRGSNLSQITEIPEDGEDLFLNILNGQVSIDDIIVLTSNRILRAVTAKELTKIFEQGSFNEAANELRHQLSEKSEDDTLVTLIGVGKESETPTAGFLSKVMSKKDKLLSSIPTKKSETTKTTDLDTDSTNQIDDSVQDPALFEEPEYGEEDAIMDSAEDLPVKKRTPKIKLPKFKVRFNFDPKLVFGITGTIFVVFILWVGGKALFGGDSAEEQELIRLKAVAYEALHEAKTFKNQGERAEAKERLDIAQEAGQKMMDSKIKDFRSEASFILSDVEDIKAEVENAREVQPTVLADLGVKNDNLQATGLMNLRGSLFVYDDKSVYKTIRNIVEKGLEVAPDELIITATARKDQNTLLFLTNQPRIIEYREGLLTPMRTEDENWKHGIDIKTYSKYAYVLDPVENQIWKYERRRANYSQAVNYNQEALDLSRAVSFAIDGAIYILQDDGLLQKIFRGKKESYEFRDLPSLLFKGKNLKIYTEQDLDFLYVLDPDNSRLLIFTKGDRFATYKKQIIFGIEGTKDFIVDEDGQKVHIMTNDKIYELAL